jgi:hypothetical protein
MPPWAKVNLRVWHCWWLMLRPNQGTAALEGLVQIDDNLDSASTCDPNFIQMPVYGFDLNSDGNVDNANVPNSITNLSSTSHLPTALVISPPNMTKHWGPGNKGTHAFFIIITFLCLSMPIFCSPTNHSSTWFEVNEQKTISATFCFFWFVATL